MASLEYNILEKVFEKKEYIFHNVGRFQLNIFGVRTKNKVADSFDDWIGVAYINEKNEQVCEAFRATTDAGTYWLKNPMKKNGTALLVPNQYLRAYRFGYHRGQYLALLQVKEMKVYRDNDKNQILDYNEATIEEGLFGINIHRTNPLAFAKNVYKWSAGCQVFQRTSEFNYFMELCKKHKKFYGNSFTYTLLLEEDFNGL